MKANRVEKIQLDYALGLINAQSKKLEDVIYITKYIPFEDKVREMKEYIERSKDRTNIENFFDFTMTALRLYTNLVLTNSYEEYDKLNSNGIIEDVFKRVEKDYKELQSVLNMCVEDMVR